MKRLVILGAGESGTGTALLAKAKNWDVFVSDNGEIKPQYIIDLQNAGVDYEQNGHSFDKILNADFIVKSPGISNQVPILTEASSKNIPIIGEIEFAAQYTNAKLIGITGTNGKTTTTYLIYDILKNAGLNVGLGGNVGQSFAKQVLENEFEYYVLELSSFQLDDMFKAKLHIAVLLNITPDHLDRYEYKFENYIDSKFRITQNQDASDFFIYNADDEVITNKIKNSKIGATCLPFSRNTELTNGAFLKDGQLIYNINNSETMIERDEYKLKGQHNEYNGLAAGVVSRILDVRREALRESLANFKNVEHRLEYVATIKGVEYINDSKATNVNSAWYALESMNRKVIWIAGGIDKGNDYEPLRSLVRGKVKAIICMGLNNLKIHEAFRKDVGTMVNVDNIKDAVAMAAHLADKNDIVLLSPACASFDLFKNYEERGRLFKQNVKAL